MENLEQKDLTPIFPCEWCFQFDDGEPTVFAATNEKINGQEPAINLTLTNTEEATVKFNHEGKSFKIFCRPLSLEGEVLINETKPNDNDEGSNGL